jgi:hypothetical protein
LAYSFRGLSPCILCTCCILCIRCILGSKICTLTCNSTQKMTLMLQMWKWRCRKDGGLLKVTQQVKFRPDLNWWWRGQMPLLTRWLKALSSEIQWLTLKTQGIWSKCHCLAPTHQSWFTWQCLEPSLTLHLHHQVREGATAWVNHFTGPIRHKPLILRVNSRAWPAMDPAGMGWTPCCWAPWHTHSG